MIRRVVMLAAVVLGAGSLASCSEQLEGDAACPLLCPQQNLDVQTVLLDAIVVDTTIAGYPELGVDSRLLLTNRGDTLETRAVIRYDDLPTTYRDPAGTETEITEVFEAALVARLLSTALNPDSPVRIDVYDVDAPTVDTVPSALLPYFRGDRRIGGMTVVPSSITDSLLRIPLLDSAVLAKIAGGQRLRVGITVNGEQSSQLHLGSFGSSPTTLSFRVNADTTVSCCVRIPVFPTSRTPVDRPFVSSLLHDFIIVARQAVPELPVGTLAVGGPNGRRAYFRFSVPQQLLESNILRATLLLTQQPNPWAPGDSVVVQVAVPAARDPIRELSRQIALVIPLHQAEGSFAPTARDLFTVSNPREGGVREIELVGLARAWRSTLTDSSSRAIVLRGLGEGEVAGEVFFYSSEAAVESVRPRLRITFVPPGGYGTP